VNETQVTVDSDRCIGSAECVRVLPDAADLGSLAEVVRNCPTGAIRVVEAGGEAL